MTVTDRLRDVKAGKQNVGGSERVARGVIGPLAIGIGVGSLAGLVAVVGGLAGTVVSVILVLAGLRMCQTAITQRCYMNAVLGRDSCRLSGVEGEPVDETRT